MKVAALLAIESVRVIPDSAGPLVTSHQNLLNRMHDIGGRPLVGHSDDLLRIAVSANDLAFANCRSNICGFKRLGDG